MKKLMFSLVVFAVVASPACAEIYNYSCKALDGKTYPLEVDDIKNVLEWRGKKFDLTEKPDCGRTGWHAENNEGSFDFCTATQGYGAIESGGNVKAECALGKAEHAAERSPKTDDWDSPPTGTAALDLRITHEYSTPKLTIRSREDSIFVRNIRINRGNCDLGRRNPWPNSTLKFGSTAWILLDIRCEPVEINVATDRGVFTYEFR
jgi:hypothetical protein